MVITLVYEFHDYQKFRFDDGNNIPAGNVPTFSYDFLICLSVYG